MESINGLHDTPLVSVVMINWNRKEILRKTLLKLREQTYSKYEIIIADNGSSDGAARMIETEFSEVVLIELQENVGIEGYNIAFEKSSGEIVVILDNDSFLEPEGIAKIVRKFRQYPKLGALGCKVLYYDSGETHHWHPAVRVEEGPAEGFDAPLFNGCAAAARRSVIEKVGFYPPEYFLYENERDFCTRIINAGYDVKYFTDIVGFHMVSREGRSNERLIFFATRNRIWYLWKYMPFGIALWKSFTILVYNLFSAAKNMQLMIYLRPFFYAIKGLPEIIKNRTPIKKEYIHKALY
ncbi:MAG: glycosyltransferase family 2 protein [Nitrospirae bacterium]|nr:glycosyltransferase family 2 protein [Nitrospirota bacterium]